MKVLVASDKFKGSLTAPEACRAIAEGLRAGSPREDLDIELIPIADGGDGIAQSLTECRDGNWNEIEVKNAVGKSIQAGYGIIDHGKTAIIEMATASGLASLSPENRDPLSASTFGTGELIRSAADKGVERIILGIGGSATNDGGTGMALALGWRFLNKGGDEIVDLPFRLREVDKIIPSHENALPPVLVACDVVNPLLGADGCTRVYGPQKGIGEDQFEEHEKRLAHLVTLLQAEDLAHQPGSGAAGGLGFGALAFLNGTLTPGFDLVSSLLGIESAIEQADLVITGEGSLDRQSLEGKAPFGVAELARKHRKHLITFCGISEDDLEEFFGEIVEIRDPDETIEVNMARGNSNLVAAASAFAKRAFTP